MKKLLLSALLSAFVLGNAFAQFRWQNDVVIGQTLQAKSTLDKDTFNVHFNTSKVNTTWAPAKTTANLGKDSISFQKATTVRGIQVKAYLDATTALNYASGTLKCDNYGSNGNPVHVFSLDSLKKIMTASIGKGALLPAVNGNVNDSVSRPAACVFDLTSTNQAFGMYPGKCKHVEYGFQFDFTGKAVTDEIIFEINTYDAGSTGKTASYELAVYSGTTISDANLIGSKVTDFYVTGSGLKTVQLAAALGKVPADFTNKKICIYLRTLGTSNALSVVDGIPNALDVNNIPVVTDQIIVFDNFNVMYGTATWIYPEGVIASTVFNHNNGTPVNLGVGSTDYTGGTPVPVLVGENNQVTFKLTDVNRIGALDITEGNDGGGHSTKFSFAATGAVMKKAADGTFSIPVAYTYTPSDGTTKMDLVIPAPTTGSINDTLQVTLTASNVTEGMTPTVRLEITNGIRFWYNVGVIGILPTSSPKVELSKVIIWNADKTIFAANATENVVVYNVAGQKVKTLTPAQAAQGVTMQQGIYIVRTANTTQKVLVK